MTDLMNHRMTMKQFRELTKDVVDEAVLVVLAPEGSSANREIIGMMILESEERFNQLAGDALAPKTTLVQLRPVRG